MSLEDLEARLSLLMGEERIDDYPEPPIIDRTLEEDYDYELLLDSLWKACRFGFNAKINNYMIGNKVSFNGKNSQQDVSIGDFSEVK